jgi:cell wall-associated NlpC family hydrolase
LLSPRGERVRNILLVVVGVFMAAQVAVAAPSGSPALSSRLYSWDQRAIRGVVARGLMGPAAAPSRFRPQAPLTAGTLVGALRAFGHPLPAPRDPAKPVSVRVLDAELVAALGLLPASRTLRLRAARAGLDPIRSLGTETVARLLGLRVNHAAETLEPEPTQAVSRAEAAYSFSRALAVTALERRTILAAVRSWRPPALGPLQRRVLRRALSFVGYPYVYAGSSERKTQTLWDGSLVPGGFDCSGLVWRVYRLQPFPGARRLTGVLHGRSSFAMSAETTRPRRIRIGALEPADVIFFGARGRRSRPAEVGHMGIYLGGGWFVHSSRHGVTLAPLTGWYASHFAWARRPLREAGFEPQRPPAAAQRRSGTNDPDESAGA